jgi:hypothetical protein
MRILTIWMLALGIFAISLARPGHAQTSGQEATTWLPAQGLYWNPDEPGIFHQVSVGPGGFVFVLIAHFTAGGEPTYLTLQGFFEPSSLDDWSTTREIGSLRSPLLRKEGGQCLGCPWRPARTVLSGLGDAEMLFFEDGRAEFRGPFGVTPLERFPLFTADQSDGAWLGGPWLVGRFGAEARLGIVMVEPEATPFGIGDSSGHRFTDVDAGVHPLIPDIIGRRLVPTGFQGFGIKSILGLRAGQLIVSHAELHERNQRMIGRGPVTQPSSTDDLIMLHLDGARIGATRLVQAWLPSQGLYYVRGELGNYLHVAVGPDGRVFATLSTFRADGEPIFLTLEGAYQPTTREAFESGPEIGRISGPLLRLSGGACLGCPHRTPQAIDAGLGIATLVFDMHGRAQLSWQGGSMALERYPLYTRQQDAPEARYQGRWLLVRTRLDSTEFAFVELEAPAAAPVDTPHPLDWNAGYPIRCIECSPRLRQLLHSLELRTLIQGGLRIDGGPHGHVYRAHDRDGIVLAEKPWGTSTGLARPEDDRIVLIPFPD